MYADKKRILETFTELVTIYSPSTNEEELALLLLEKLSVLGLDYKRDDFGNIIAIMPETEGIVAEPIFFSAHLDVVEPCENVRPVIEEVEGKTIIKSSGDTVLGADDKAGLAMIFEAITCLIENDIPHGRIELILTLQEENGLFGSRYLDKTGLESKFGYILDHEAPVGHLINRAPQHDILEFTFKGKAAHSGLHPEDGVSAIIAAATAVKDMPYGKLGEETTANVGTIKGGNATNIIPDECILTCEVRSHDVKKLNTYVEEYIEAANHATAEIEGTSVTFKRDTEYRKINLSEDEPLIQVAKEAAGEINLEFELVTTCGGSDANNFVHQGLISACLGCGYDNPHATNEQISLDELVNGANYLISISQTVIKENTEQQETEEEDDS